MLIPKKYYLNHDVVFLAKDLLGKVLLTECGGMITSGVIVETEAYRAPEDKASHAYNNRMTERTRTMYLAGGLAYIYLCYGIHQMCNVVTGEEGFAHAVLIRAIQPLDGIQTMLQRRNQSTLTPALTRGPGCVCKALNINRQLNAVAFYHPKSPLRIYDRGILFLNTQISSSKRIGVEYAGESANWLYRFYINDNCYVSKHPR